MADRADTALGGCPAAPAPARLPLGLNLPTWEDRHGRAARWADVRALAQAAEAAGVDTLWVPATAAETRVGPVGAPGRRSGRLTLVGCGDARLGPGG
jgi:hypothetical protein